MLKRSQTIMTFKVEFDIYLSQIDPNTSKTQHKNVGEISNIICTASHMS